MISGSMSKKMRNKAKKMLQKARIRKPVYIIKAEYRNYCETGERSARDKTGFLSAITIVADDGAKAWINDERTRLDKEIEGVGNGHK